MSSECTLIADRTDDAVQLSLGFIALSSLYCKWHFETPRRPVKIWFLDAMKQGTSAAMIHVLNIFFAIATADTGGKPSESDECAFYFMNVVIDTTLGVYIAYLLLHVVTSVAVRYGWTELKHSGRYGDPPSLRVWAIQLLSWMLVLCVMKVIVAAAIYMFRTPLGIIGSLLFFPVHHHPKIELLIVMIGCPLVMNMVQFWIQDSFLKDHADAVADGEVMVLSAKGTPTRYGAAEVQPTTRRELSNLFGLLGADKRSETLPHKAPSSGNKVTNTNQKKSDGTTAEDLYEVL